MPDRIKMIIEASRTAGLEDALWNYWPTRPTYEVAEATPLLYVSRAFQDAGFNTYMEVPHHTKRQRMDLLAVRWQDKLTVGFEGKRLYDGNTAAAMAHDFHNLMAFVAPHDAKLSELPKGKALGVILGTCWRKSMVDWWTDAARKGQPARCRHGGWRKLAAALDQCPLVDAVGIYEPKRLGGKQQQYLVYAVFEVPLAFRPAP